MSRVLLVVPPPGQDALPADVIDLDLYLCLGCDTLYALEKEVATHARVFACGPWRKVEGARLPPWSGESPAPWHDPERAPIWHPRFGAWHLAQPGPFRLGPGPAWQRYMRDFAQWWRALPATEQRAHAAAPFVLFARREGFL